MPISQNPTIFTHPLHNFPTIKRYLRIKARKKQSIGSISWSVEVLQRRSEMKRTLRACDILIFGFLLLFLLAGCAGMNHTGRNVLAGTAIGAGTGAVVGSVAGGDPAAGALIGGAAGALGGYIYDQSRGYHGRYYYDRNQYNYRGHGNRYNNYYRSY